MTLSWLAHSEDDLPPHTEWLGAWEAARLARMRFTKRRNDFLVARWTAKRAIALRLGETGDLDSARRVEIVNASSGAPEAFVDGRRAPLEISMTDRAGWGVCLVTAETSAVGCDLELIEPRSDLFVHDYLTEAEQRVVNSAGSDHGRDLLANLFWCAKESALKVLRTGLRRDTRSVEVSLCADAPTGGWQRLEVRDEEGPVFPGWWRRFGQFLLTVAATDGFDPPAPLDGALRLETGIPTENWMSAPVVDPNVG